METVPFITYIPDNTIELNIIATILNNDDTMSQAELNLGIKDIKEGMIDGDHWKSENAEYTLADKGEKYILKSIKHSGRKGLRGTDCIDSKYDGLIGCECQINIDEIQQFKTYKFYIDSPEYEWWRTSEVLALSMIGGTTLVLETANSIYSFEKVEV